MFLKGSTCSAILKGIAVQKVAAAGAAAVVAVSAVGTAAKLSSDYIASNSQQGEPQSTIVAEELGVPAAAQSEEAAVPAGELTAAPEAAPAGYVTSIREGNQVVRREYYDESSNLLEYSDVLDYDSETNSYTENVYRHDEETGRDVLVRTETYRNGQLVTSDTPGTPAATPVPDATPSPTQKPAWLGRVTSITANGQVIRREYYDTDGRLREYSDVVNDSETGTYVENVYRYDEETGGDILVRTETNQVTTPGTQSAPAPTAAPAPVAAPAPTAAPVTTPAPETPAPVPVVSEQPAPPAESAPVVVPDSPAESTPAGETAPGESTPPDESGEQSES